MNAMKRTVAIIMAILLLVGAIPSVLFAYAADMSSSQNKVLFSSSFESSDPAVKESQSDNGYYKGLERYEMNGGSVKGEFTDLVDLSSIAGNADFNANETKQMLFDRNSGTKFLTDLRPNQTDPVVVSFSLTEAAVLGEYGMTSANDAEDRDPKAWTLYGSVDGTKYTRLDTRQNQSFSNRFVTNIYKVNNDTAYKFYKLEITGNNGAGMTQFADLRLGTGKETAADKASDSPMVTEPSSGPQESWAGTGAFDGKMALAVYAKQTTKEETYARNLLYSGLNIKVSENTRLSYVHFASIAASGYDYEYVAMYMMVDVKFTDGTYLSDLNAIDQNGFGMDPISKGESESLYSNQWNYVETVLGKVAEGKTIDSLYIYFRKNKSQVAKKFLAYFDDIVIENKDDPEYEHLSDYVSILRGTNDTTAFSRGLTTPLVTMPNGFNFYTPVTNYGANTHYDYFDNAITHFSVSHVPSTWVGDYGTWQFMANTSVNTSDLSKVGNSAISTSALSATFSHDNEVAKAHYYSVQFDEGSRASGVKVEITPTTHGVYVRFTFPEDADNVNIMFDCVRAGGSLTLNADGSFTAKSEHTSNGSTPMHVSGKFDQKPSAVKTSGKVGVAVFPKGTTEVTMKFATSYLTANQAKHSLNLEIPDDATFDSTFAKAQKAWDEVLGRIEVEGASYTQLVTLYSNLYRMYAYPNLYSENKGTNENPDWVYSNPYRAGRVTSGKLYVNNGFWDTYRTAWAAYALITPEFDGELLNGIIEHYDANGWIPRWIAPGGANSMLGTSSDIIFADAYIKGIEFDYETAFESMLKNAATVTNNSQNGGRVENNTAIFTGYVTNKVENGFSWTMEDYISDFCIAMMADQLGYEDEAEYYFNRARFYVTMYNSSVRFFMGKKPDGSWTSPKTDDYDPHGWWGDYAETNGWTMCFAPVFDGDGLAALYGSQKQLLRKLEEYFDDSYAASGGGIHEEVEAREVRMGLYSHSNQPAHAIPYLYVYAGAPYRTQEVVREVLSRLYVGAEIGQGYLGDEDNGEMSSWYVLSALGLYPQSMGSGQYVIGSPLFEKATVHMDNGKDLVIIANNNSNENIYVQSLTVNGKAHNNAFIDHSVIADGATLVFEMGSERSSWGTGSTPTSLTENGKAVPAKDLVTSSFTVLNEEAGAELKNNTVYVGSITNAGNLFDDDSNTHATLSNGDSIVIAPAKASRVLVYTVSSADNANSAPEGLKLEASADGASWVVLDEREDLTYQWGKYTRGYAISDEAFANYRYYRLTFVGDDSMQVSEVELLALSSDGDVGTPSEKLATPKPGTTEDPAGPVDPSNPQTPSTSEPGGSAEPDGAPVGLIIGIVAGVVVLLGGGITVVILLKKKRK